MTHRTLTTITSHFINYIYKYFTKNLYIIYVWYSDIIKIIIQNISLLVLFLVWYEPTDSYKALKIFEAGSSWQKILKFVSPNINELLTIARHFKISVPDEKFNITFETIKTLSEQLAKIIPVVITTLGSSGVLVSIK